VKALRWPPRLRREDWRLLRRWFRYLRPFRGALATAAGLLLVATGLQLATPLLTGLVIDRVLLAKRAHLLHWVALLLVAVTLAFMAVNLLRSYVLARVKVRVALSMHQDLVRHLHELSFTYTTRRQSGYLVSRVLEDPGTVYEFMTSNLLTILQNAVTFVVALGVMLWLSWKTALLSLLVLPAYVALGAAFVSRLRDLSAQATEATAERSRVLFETLAGLYTTNACCAEGQMLRRFFAQQKDVARKQIAQFLLGSKVSFLRGSMAALGPIVVLWYGGLAVIRGDLTIGELVAFGAIFGYLFNSAQSLSATHVSLQRVFVALERVFEILDQRPAVPAALQGSTPEAFERGIELAGVRFSYDGRQEVLHGVDLLVPAGKVVALVGRSGAGKSTLAHLLMRFYDPTEGTIRIDGVDLKDLSLPALRRWIALVPQDVFLLSTSVEDNLRLGMPRASREEVERAARLADAHEFIVGLPQGYATPVGERGFNLSGGQRQRLGVARALLRRPKLLVLDEAASAVDGASEMAICRTVRTLNVEHGITSIVIAHRLSTILTSDRIVLVEDGRVVAAGSHAELLESCAAYRELIRFQFGSTAAGLRSPLRTVPPLTSTHGEADEPASVAHRR